MLTGPKQDMKSPNDGDTRPSDNGMFMVDFWPPSWITETLLFQVQLLKRNDLVVSPRRIAVVTNIDLVYNLIPSY